MKLATLSQLKSEADLKCLSCFCPGHEEALQFTTYTAAFFHEIGTEPDE